MGLGLGCSILRGCVTNWLRVCNKEGSTRKRGYLKQQKFNKMKETQPKIMTRWMQAVGRRVRGDQPPAYMGWPADQGPVPRSKLNFFWVTQTYPA